MKKRPTIRDVAKRAGISLSTVSLVINNRGYVRDETRRKVLTVVRELAYHPTRTARGLASKTSGNLGFILSDYHFSQAEQFYTKIFLGTEFEARGHNYYILLTTVGRTFGRTRTIPRFLLEHNVDGVIVAGKVPDTLIDYMDTLGLPIVLVDYQSKKHRHSTIVTANRMGARMAMQHLVDLGHRSVGFIAGDIDHPSIAERFAGFQEVLREHAIPPDEQLIVVNQPSLTENDGAEAIDKILRRGKVPTAIFAANDPMAIGCAKYLRDRGVKIPAELSLVGFDDIEMSSHLEPPLTTVRVLKEEMGKLAVRRIVEMISSTTSTIVTTQVPVELVIRESTSQHVDGEAAPETPAAPTPDVIQQALDPFRQTHL